MATFSYFVQEECCNNYLYIPYFLAIFFYLCR